MRYARLEDMTPMHDTEKSRCCANRTWTIVWGVVSLFTVLLPSFQNYRMFSFLGLVATTFTAWYMMGTAVHEGQVEGVMHSGPIDAQLFLTGATNILFTFGGHAMAV